MIKVGTLVERRARSKMVRGRNGMRQEPVQPQEEGVVLGPSERPRSTLCGAQENQHHRTGSRCREQNIKRMGTFSSVEQSRRFYSLRVVPPWNMTGHGGFLLCKEGMKPMWEDDANKKGGKCVIWLWKGLACCCWRISSWSHRGSGSRWGGNLRICVVSGGYNFTIE